MKTINIPDGASFRGHDLADIKTAIATHFEGKVLAGKPLIVIRQGTWAPAPGAGEPLKLIVEGQHMVKDSDAPGGYRPEYKSVTVELDGKTGGPLQIKADKTEQEIESAKYNKSRNTRDSFINHKATPEGTPLYDKMMKEEAARKAEIAKQTLPTPKES